MKQKFNLGDKVKLTRIGYVCLDDQNSAHIGMEMTIVNVEFIESDNLFMYKTNSLQDFADWEMEIV